MASVAASSILAIPALGETPSVPECVSLAIIVLGVPLASRPAAVAPTIRNA
jgi:uncharacterized membrane protein